MEVQSDLSCHMTLRHVIIHQVKSHGNTGCANSSELIVPGKLHRVKVHIFVVGAGGQGRGVDVGMVLLALAVLLATAD